MKKKHLFAAALVLGGGAALVSNCSSKVPHVAAHQISSRADLIGGPGSLGDVGDYLLANEQIRLVIQGPGYSRGFGLYGGSLIDADLQRPHTANQGTSAVSKGKDNFSELFPAIFLKAMKPKPGGIVTRTFADGSAAIVVTGTGDEFLFIAERINDLLVDSSTLLFENEYKLAPGKRYVEITTTVKNQGDVTVEFPGQGITQLSEMLNGFTMPVGDVILFGAGNSVFSEQAGFDMRFTLEKLYKTAPALPKLPGLVIPFLATKGKGISYGFMSGITDPAFSFAARTNYENAPVDSLIVPFIASSFTGAFYGAAPATLPGRTAGAPPAQFQFKKYFIVGRGDVASIRDVVHDIWREKNVEGRPHTFGVFSGRVRDQLTLAADGDVSVVTFRSADNSPYNQHTPDEEGNFSGTYEEGKYTYRVVSKGRFTTPPAEFEVKAGAATYLDIMLPPPGIVTMRVLDGDGRLMPARCSLVGTYDPSNAGKDPKEFLYDLRVGEEMRPTDLVADNSDPATREYIEHVIFAPNGQSSDHVRPGNYRAVCSRGMEYDTFTQDIVVKSGATVMIDATLNHVVNTEGWASGDYHLHADPSVDSSLPLTERIAHCATEGLDIACSSDHNFVTDYAPVIASMGLESWIQGMVGLEMTTLEIGHFNGFPLTYDPGPITKGAFEWSGRKPKDLFADIRGLGRYGPDHTIVQVNHPRDTILGYFNDYNFNPDTGEPEEDDALLRPLNEKCVDMGEGVPSPHCEFGKDSFSYEFDAIEIYNGKRFDIMHTYRVPEVLPPPPLPALETIPPAGSVLRDEDGKVAFPGGMEDWFALLNRGYIYTAMANSDTHSLEDEPGIPRTYTPVSDDNPGAINELEVVAALKTQKAMLTNGPFVRVNATGTGPCLNQVGAAIAPEKTACGMGEVVPVSGGSVTVNVAVESAPWIAVDTLNIYRNGEMLFTANGDNTTLASRTENIAIDGDGFIVVEVTGTKSMWPVIVPLEVPSLQISDALGSIGSAFGVNFNPFGNLSPKRTTVAHAFAFTNPIFVDGDGDGRYLPRGVEGQALRAAGEPRVRGKKPDGRSVPLLVKMFGAFAGHGHQH